jgi:hypothetical protein
MAQTLPQNRNKKIQKGLRPFWIFHQAIWRRILGSAINLISLAFAVLTGLFPIVIVLAAGLFVAKSILEVDFAFFRYSRELESITEAVVLCLDKRGRLENEVSTEINAELLSVEAASRIGWAKDRLWRASWSARQASRLSKER